LRWLRSPSFPALAIRGLMSAFTATRSIAPRRPGRGRESMIGPTTGTGVCGSSGGGSSCGASASSAPLRWVRLPLSPSLKMRGEMSAFTGATWLSDALRCSTSPSLPGLNTRGCA